MQDFVEQPMAFGPPVMEPRKTQHHAQPAKQSGSSPSAERPERPLQWDEIPITQSPQGQDQLTLLLSQAYAAQATYGDKAQMMEWRDAMFQLILGRFPFRQVKGAFVKFLERNRDLPTPSDIVNIIEPPQQQLSAAMYVSLRKRAADGEWLLSDDRAYIEAFEAQEMAKMRGGSDELRSAQREVDNYRNGMEADCV